MRSLSPSLAGLANVINAGLPIFGVYDSDPVWAAQAVKLAHAYVRGDGRPHLEWTATTGWRGGNNIVNELGLDRTTTNSSGPQLSEAIGSLEATLRPESDGKRRRAQFPMGLVVIWDVEKFWDSGSFRYLIPSLDLAVRTCEATVAFILPEPIPSLMPLATVLPQVAASGDAGARYASLLKGAFEGLDPEQETEALEILTGLPIKVAAAVMELAAAIQKTTPTQAPVGLIWKAARFLKPPKSVGSGKAETEAGDSTSEPTGTPRATP